MNKNNISYILISFIITILSSLILITACTTDTISKELRDLKSRIETNPDSVMKVLKKYRSDDLKSEYNQSLHALLSMMAQDKCYLPLMPDSVLDAAIAVFHDKNDLPHEVMAGYYSGLSYKHWGKRNDIALATALLAIDCAHANGDPYWIAKCHDLAHEIYKDTYDYYNAAREVSIAADYFKKAGKERPYRWARLEKAIAINAPLRRGGKLHKEGIRILDSLKSIAITDRDTALIYDVMKQKISEAASRKKWREVGLYIDTLQKYSPVQEWSWGLKNEYVRYLIFSNSPYSGPWIDWLKDNAASRTDTIAYLHTNLFYALNKNDTVDAYIIQSRINRLFTEVLTELITYSTGEAKSRYIRTRESEAEEKHQLTKIIFILISVIILMTAGGIIYRLRERIVRQRNHMEETMDRLQSAIYDNGIKENNLKEMSEKMESMNKSHEMFVVDMKEKHLSLEKILGNRYDALCSLVSDFYNENDTTERHRKIFYKKVMDEIKAIKSKKNITSIVNSVNRYRDNIVTRFSNQLPQLVKEDAEFIALVFAGLAPSTISILLDMNLKTIYSKRSRMAERIKNSNAPDKTEFLSYFRKSYSPKQKEE